MLYQCRNLMDKTATEPSQYGRSCALVNVVLRYKCGVLEGCWLFCTIIKLWTTFYWWYHGFGSLAYFGNEVYAPQPFHSSAFWGQNWYGLLTVLWLLKWVAGNAMIMDLIPRVFWTIVDNDRYHSETFSSQWWPVSIVVFFDIFRNFLWWCNCK